MQITNDEFAKILIKICKKIIVLKGIELSLPEVLSRDLNAKYRECQKIVDFLKQIGYKADLNLNNILFPSIRDMQRLFEYTLEYITSVDTGVLEFGQNISGKNFTKIKLSKQLTNWTKEMWILPELKYGSETNRGYNKEVILKYEKNKFNTFKKRIGGSGANISENSNLRLKFIFSINNFSENNIR